MTEAFRISAFSVASQQSVNSEDIGGVDVDLFTGAFRRRHELLLDQSGGESELALTGLIYDSSVVHLEDSESAGSELITPVVRAVIDRAGDPYQVDSITAELKWYNAEDDAGGTNL